MIYFSDLKYFKLKNVQLETEVVLTAVRTQQKKAVPSPAIAQALQWSLTPVDHDVVNLKLT